GPLQREKALGVADAPRARAGRAGFGLGAGLGAGARAGLAGDRGRNPQLRGLAGKRLVEADLHVVAQIGAALAAGAAAARSAHAENAFEQIRECGAEIRPEIAAGPAAAVLEGGMAETVIGGALVAVLEHLVGFVDLLELVLALVVRV